MSGEFFNAVKGEHGARLLGELEKPQLGDLAAHFPTYAHDGQRPPACARNGGDWRTWMIIAGRGFGKTRAGAEWVLSVARGDFNPPRAGEELSGLRIALVAATIEEARAVMVEGPSGLLRLARDGEIADWSAARRTLSFANGAQAFLYSGANPESLRGPEHHFAWCDELAKWKHARASWDNLQLGLRMGAFPRAVVTTTPRASDLLVRLRAAPDTAETGGSTRANPHLPAAFAEAMQAQYGGTRLGLQEIEGRLLEDVQGSLWPVSLVERCRVRKSDSHLFTRTVIGVDPPASAGGTCGIVVCAVAGDGCAYVLADCSVTGASPEEWARAVADAAARFDADRVVAERNQGGDMVRAVLLAAEANLPVELVHAARGKGARAEPVAALFENGRAFFAGEFAELEAELARLTPGPSTGSGLRGGASPDRADACVWALWALMLKTQRPEPKITPLDLW